MRALKEIVTLVILAVLIVVPIRLFIAQPFVVDGESMYPTFKNADYLIVDELSYRFHAPERGDIVIFRYPKDPSLFFIKRIIGLPGESVAIVGGKVTITKTDGEKDTLDEPYVVEEDATYSSTVTLGDNQYFVMGDNRPNSSDSRYWGPLPASDIVGRAFARVLPTAHAGFFPGEAALPQ